MRMNNKDRNTYVKKQITDAILSLLEENELCDISIGDITELAQVSRISFYRNYNSKEDIVREKVFRLFDEWQKDNDTIRIKEETGADELMLSDLFGFLKSNDAFFLLLKKRNLFYLVRDTLKLMIGPKPDDSNSAAYFSAFVCNGLYGWIDEWLSRGMQESQEKMLEMLCARNIPQGEYRSKKDFC